MARDIKDEQQGESSSPLPDSPQSPMENLTQGLPLDSLQLPLDARQQRIAVRIVAEDYDSAKAARDSQKYGFDAKLGRETGYDAFIKQLKDLYFGYREFKDIPWRFCSNRSLMIAMAITETLHARMFPGVYNEDLVNWRPTKTVAKDRAETLSTFMSWWIRVHAPERDFFDRWVRHNICFGRVLSVQSWDVFHVDRGQKTSAVPIMDESGQPMMGADGPMNVPPQKVVERIEKSRSDIIPDEDIFLPKGATDIQRDPVIIQRTYFYRDLEEMEREGKVINITFATDPSITPLKNLLPIGSGTTTGGDVDEDEELKNIKRRNIPVKVLQAWSGIDLDGDSYPEQVVVMTVPEYNLYIGGVQVSDLSARGTRHIDLTMYLPRVDEVSGLRGIGALEMVKELALEIDAIFNQMTDANTLQVLRPGFYDPGGDLTAPNLKIAPNVWHPVANPQQSIFMPEVNIPTEKLILAIRLVGEFIEKLTGASAYVMGKESDIVGGSGTATRTAAIVGASNERHSIPVERMREGAARILTQHLDLVQMNLPPGMEERVLGPDNEPLFDQGDLSRETLAGDYDAYLLPDDSMGSKEARRQLSFQRYQLLMQNPLVMTDAAKIYKATADLLKDWGDDPQAYLGQEPDILNSYAPNVENTMMMAGNFQHVKAQLAQNPIQHILEHLQLEKDPIFATLPPEVQQKVLEFRDAHVQEHGMMFQAILNQINQNRKAMQANGPQGDQPRPAGPTAPTEAQSGMGPVSNPLVQASQRQRSGESGISPPK